MSQQAQLKLCDAAQQFLSKPEHFLFIDGKRIPAATNETIDCISPATGKVVGQIAAGDKVDVDKAVAAARAAFEGPWSKWTPYERQKLLFRAHVIIEQHYEELAQIESVDMGMPIARTRATELFALKAIQFFAAQALSIVGETLQNGIVGDVMTMSLRAPVGVVGGIIPWNGPLPSQWWLVGATIASGCTIVLKPAEDASFTVLRVAELLHEIGLPPGVLNVVTGRGSTAGEALARHPDVDRIAFTGSTATGRKIIEASTVNIKKLQLELGGKSPDIIFADADLDKAVPGAAMGVFQNSGQVCYAGTRVFVQRPIVKEFCARVAAFTATVKVGLSLDENAFVGPLISKRQLDRVMSYIRLGVEEGAQIEYGGERLSGDFADGFFVSPTIFSGVNNNMTIAREEIFGPVLSVIPFDTVEEAIALGNQTEFGLGGAVWSRDISTAFKVVKGIHTGMMWVNCYGVTDPLVGFGGTKHSGYGAKGGRFHLDTYLYNKTVYINL